MNDQTDTLNLLKEKIIDGYKSGFYHWEVDTEKNESWDDYVDRSINEALDAVKHLNPEANTEKQLINLIRYNLHLEAEDNSIDYH